MRPTLFLTLSLTLFCQLWAAEVTPKLSDADFPAPSPSARHTEKVAAVKSGNYDLLLIGDSITHTIGELDGKYEAMKAVWEKHYAPRHAINLGFNGYRTEQILWNLQNGELDFAQSPKVAMILIGTNNSDDRHFQKVHTAEEIFTGTKAIVELIKLKHPSTKILVLRIFPRGGDAEKGVSPPDFNSSAQCIETCRRAGELTAKLADDKQVFWLDINQVFLRPDGTINTDLMWDLLHPSPAGGEAWAQAIEPTLAKLMGEKPGDVIAPAADNDGFVSVFNGKDFTGWNGPVDNYEIKDGAIVCKPGKGGTIFTKEEYADFVVKLEFKVPAGCNNGLAIRYPGSGDTAYTGMCELQVLDENYDKLKHMIDERQVHGSAYGMVAAKRGFQKPTGEWNSQEVTVKGSTIKVVLNGTVILDCDLSKVDMATVMANSQHPGVTRKSGFFGFAGHNDSVEFRNIFIKKL